MLVYKLFDFFITIIYHVILKIMQNWIILINSILLDKHIALLKEEYNQYSNTF